MAVPKTLQAGRIMAMPAGRELDAMVAERVFGWTDIRPDTHETIGTTILVGQRPDYQCPAEVPHFSTDIYHAWKVTDWLWERWGAFELAATVRLWLCGPCLNALAKRPDRVACGIGDTAPLAICRAALLAIME